MRRTGVRTAVLVGALFAAACAVPKALPPEPDAPAAQCGPTVAAALLPRFAVRLLGEASERGRRNAVVSPLGIEAALGMAAAGGSERVREAAARLFAEEDADAEWMPECGLAAARAGAAADAGVDLAVAAGAFADRTLALQPAFRAALEGGFGAKVEGLDFSDEGAAERINGWVRRETGGAVPRLVDRLEPLDALVLASAVHFRGTWAHAFDPALTTPRPFRLAAGGTVEAPAMEGDELPARYREDEHFQAVELAYGDGMFAFVAVLPREDLDPAEALARLAADPGWLAGRGFRRATGRLVLPRLGLEGRAELLPALKRLGLEEALADPNAFAGVAAPAPALGRVLHAARLALDERGTEAAAATAAAFETRAAIVDVDRFDMTVDRPFALAVRQTGGGLPFAAWVADPVTGR